MTVGHLQRIVTNFCDAACGMVRGQDVEFSVRREIADVAFARWRPAQSTGDLSHALQLSSTRRKQEETRGQEKPASKIPLALR